MMIGISSLSYGESAFNVHTLAIPVLANPTVSGYSFSSL